MHSMPITKQCVSLNLDTFYYLREEGRWVVVFNIQILWGPGYLFLTPLPNKKKDQNQLLDP